MNELKFYALPNWSEINQCEVWDFCYLDEKPNSPFQFQINMSRAKLNEHIIKEYTLFPKTNFNTLDNQIMGAIYGRLFSNHSIINTNIGFLEYQYRATKDKNIFLNVLEQITDITNYTAFGADAMVNAPDIVRAVKSWRERKIEQLSYIEHLKDVKTHNRKDKNNRGSSNDLQSPREFVEMFNNSLDAELCLGILRDLDKPYLDADYNYIGKNKGIFPMWINVLKNHAPKPLIKHFPDLVYKDILNRKITGLRLSKDASEFRRTYKRLANDRVELQIKTLLSQLSQSGRLGK